MNLKRERTSLRWKIKITNLEREREREREREEREREREDKLQMENKNNFHTKTCCVRSARCTQRTHAYIMQSQIHV